MPNYNKIVSHIGEDVAALYLQEKGYEIIERNYYLQWGELDIVAKYNQVWTFIEVKTRIGDKHGLPYEAISQAKLKRLKRSIEIYTARHNLYHCRMSLDIIGITLSNDRVVKEIKHYTNIDL